MQNLRERERERGVAAGGLGGVGSGFVGDELKAVSVSPGSGEGGSPRFNFYVGAKPTDLAASK